MCIHVCVRARIQDSHVHVRGRPSWSTECISLCQPVAKIPLRNRSFGGEPWSDTRETQTVTVAHLLVILAVHLWHHLMWKRQDFFSHLLVGRSSLSICSCVIKSLKDLTAICLCYINYQDEAVQKSPQNTLKPLHCLSRWQTPQPTEPLHCILWLPVRALRKFVREHETSNQGRLRLPVVTHPDDWLPTAFQSRRQSWSGDTSWCPHCLWGYSLASPLKRTSHANRNR